MSNHIDNYTCEVTALLRELVTIPSPSGEEHTRSDFLVTYLAERGIDVERVGNTWWHASHTMTR